MNQGPENEVYIYRAMQAEAGYRTLKNELYQHCNGDMNKIEEVKKFCTPIWLLRESNTPGMLTIDYIFWNKFMEDWQCNSRRMALTQAGWVDAMGNDLETIKNKMKAVSPEMAENNQEYFQSTLLKHITATKKFTCGANFTSTEKVKVLPSKKSKNTIYYRKINRNQVEVHFFDGKGFMTSEPKDLVTFHENVKTITDIVSFFELKKYTELETFQFTLNIENRINPGKNEQTNTKMFSTYAPSAGNSIDVPLTQGFKQAITCELSGEILSNPVVMIKDKIIKLNKVDFTLEKGKSYEKYSLQQANVKDNEFYPNLALKNLINRIGSGNEMKVLNAMDERGQDNVILMEFDNPYILSSGHSLNYSTIQGMVKSGRTLACPFTRKTFELRDVVPNKNLERFLQMWPDCQKLLLGQIKMQQEEKLKKALQQTVVEEQLPAVTFEILRIIPVQQLSKSLSASKPKQEDELPAITLDRPKC